MTNQSYTYTPFGKASLILQIREYAPDGTPLARPDTISSRRIIYGPDHQRWQTVLTDSTGVATTISYAPGCDVVQRGSVKTTSYYLEADGALVAIVKATSTYSDLFLAETDHLGSLTGLVNESGTEFYSAEFDAWGQRTVTHSGTGVVTPGFLASGDYSSNYMPLRGYTGHEHYMECGLTDMNGRMYDPLTARFLSPDPYVQRPDNPQNFNRYAYCLNNPLMYTDPSGEIIWEAIIVAAIMGGTMNVAMNAENINSLGDVVGYYAVGALAGAAGGVVGQALAGSIGTLGFINGFATAGSAGFSSGFINGAGNAWVGGSNFGEGLMLGLQSGLISGVAGGMVGGISGGVVAKINDRSFWDGASVTKEVLSDQKLPIVGQNAKMNCVAACGESLTDGDWSQDYIRNQWDCKIGRVTDPDSEGISDVWAYKKYADKLGRSLDYKYSEGNYLSLDKIVNSMQQGNRVGITYQVYGNNESGYHNVLLNKVTYKVRIKPNGKIVSRYIFQVMDPAAGGSYRVFNQRTLLSSNTSFLILR